MNTYNYNHFKPSYYDLTLFPGPKAGEKFMNITLTDLAGQPIDISDLLDKPLVIETGSITCPMYAKCVPKMNDLAKKFPHINFVLIYVREAHPGNRTTSHQSMSAKRADAAKVKPLYQDNRQVLVDDLQGSFHLKYGGMPDMTYVIDTDGTVIFRGDWNNPQMVTEVLQSFDQHKIYSNQHFTASKPAPSIAIKALSQGGRVAIWDFIKELPGLIKLHKKADKAYNQQ